MREYKLAVRIQTWIRVAQEDNRGHISAFEYAANTSSGTPDVQVTFVRKGNKGFAKLLKAYFEN